MKSKLLSAALTGFVLASTAGAADSVTPDKKSTPMGECHGVNSCKGTGQCGGQNHSCAGLNECKGKGWISMTEKECSSKKGKWKKSAGMMHSTTPKK